MFITPRLYQALVTVLFTLFLTGCPIISTDESKDVDDGAQQLIRHQGTYGELGREFWRWAVDNEYAMFVDGDVNCGLGQDKNKVWFLAGTSFDATDVRNCTIKKGKKLFIPLATHVAFYNPITDPLELDLTVEQKRIFLDGVIGGGSLSDDSDVAALAAFLGIASTVVCEFHANLDGKPLIFTTPIVRAQSEPGTIGPDDEGLADGFYALLEPLKDGNHVLEFGSASCNVSDGSRESETTVIYNISVQ